MPFSKTFAPGEILTAANVNDHLLNGGYQFRETVYFTSSGTFTKADYPWLRAIRVRCVGGGGGGTGAPSPGSGQVSGGSSGSGAAYAESFITDIAGLAASVTVTRGGGGAGGVGAAGNNGQASSFGALVSASGGVNGLLRASGTPPLGVRGNDGQDTGTGDIVIKGQPGGGFVAPSTAGVSLSHNAGGGSHLGGGGLPGVVADGGAGGIGGGGGGCVTTGAGARTGGAGGNGIVIVELYA